MEKVAPPIFMHQALQSRFCDVPMTTTATTKKRDLSYDVDKSSSNGNWNPNAWSWDSVRFIGKPVPQQNGIVSVEEETLRLNLGSSGVSGSGGSVDPSVLRPSKRVRSGSPTGTASYPMCQVDNCKEDLSSAKDYHRRHKVCELHSKASKAPLGNQMQRFCQQCSRFHPLTEFDEGKRSCRRRLAGHNRRRRKTQPEDVTSQPESVATGNAEIFNLLSAIASSQGQKPNGKFEDRSKIASQVPDKDQLVQILNRIPLPADLAAKLLNVGGKGQIQTSSYHHDKVNQSNSGPLTKDLLAVLSTTLSASTPNSQKSSQSSDSEKSRASADQVGESLQMRQHPQEFASVGDERSSGSSQSPVEDSDFPEVRVNLPLQLFSSSPEVGNPPKLTPSQKYFSSDSSNPVEERSPSSSPAVDNQFDLQGVARGLKADGVPSRREVNANKEASQSQSYNISLNLFNAPNSRVQPSSLQSVPFQAEYASSGSDHSPPSLNSDAQDRTGRIMFKLFDKDPSHFPGTLRTQIYNWLSNSPSDMESYIRPGCVVLSLYASMSSAAWEQLEENFLQHVHSLIQSNSDFWRIGRFLVHSGNQLALHKDGKIHLCKPWRTWRSPELISVSPLAIVSGQETSFSLKGRNLSNPGTKIHCTGTGGYTPIKVVESACYGMTYDKIKLSGIKVQDASPGLLGRCFIEVENGFKGSSFPVIIADATICKELRPLESEFDKEENASDAISDEHGYDLGRPRSREETLHFLNELGWLFQRKRFSYTDLVPDYSLDRFRFILTFSVERNCCMLVKTLLDMLVQKYLEGQWSSTASLEMLNAIQLLNRAVKRKYVKMVDLLIQYAVPSNNDASRKYVFPPNVAGPDGITPLHLAACTSSSEGVIDSLTNDPQEIGLNSWDSLLDANGQTPHAYAMMRNNHSYNVLVARKLSNRRRGHVSVTINSEIEHSSMDIELKQRQSDQTKRGQNSCTKCSAMADVRYSSRIPGSRSFGHHRPFIHSILAIAAVCVCVCLFLRGHPWVGSVTPFNWEKLDYGTI
ncbi:squamosa promoter-binding-like protein 14 isoform X1 [Arachis stenosperma]|uniref:squamosa promoter-binding-like protein 14 isoform X1 n=1 Tax=Arachis stenosperma TaxID=217475 RepID=UPI0025AD86DE|nr:squamosa promoter-binding-like protein 14 isoform X1 [Arachis stenosperma]